MHGQQNIKIFPHVFPPKTVSTPPLPRTRLMLRPSRIKQFTPNFTDNSQHLQ